MEKNKLCRVCGKKLPPDSKSDTCIVCTIAEEQDDTSEDTQQFQRFKKVKEKWK